MRNTFINKLFQIARQRKDIVLMAGDLGYGVLDEFAAQLPNNFINTGISEQNMASAAAGMALEGKAVFVYTIGNFATIRCLEQVRNGAAYHNANVKFISVGAGISYGSLGATHHSTEDIAAVRSIPNMTLFSPADPVEAELVAVRVTEMNTPCYIRLGKGKEKIIHSDRNFDITSSQLLRSGVGIAIIATGAIVSEALDAHLILEQSGISCAVYSFPLIKPLNESVIKDIAKHYSFIFTLEEHNILGGFGGGVSEVVASVERSAIVERIGINDVFTSMVGSYSYLKDYYGLSAEQIVKRIKSFL